MTYPFQIPLHRYAHRQLVDETDLNEFSDLINYPPYCLLQRSTTLNIPNGAGYTNIPWETEVADNDGMWVIGNPTAIIPTHSFVGRVQAAVHWPTVAVVGVDLRIVKSPGSIIIGHSGIYGINRATGTGQQVISKPFAFTAGDIIVIQARHDDAAGKLLQPAVEDGCWVSLQMVHSGTLGTV